MCIFLLVLCSLSCLLFVLDTTRDLTFPRSNFGFVVTVIVVIEVRVLDRGSEFVQSIEVRFRQGVAIVRSEVEEAKNKVTWDFLLSKIKYL